VAVIAKLADMLELHRLVRNFLLVVVTHRRTPGFAGHAAAFRASDGRAAGLGPAEVTSARELGEPQRKEIDACLEASSENLFGRRTTWTRADRRAAARAWHRANTTPRCAQARKHAAAPGAPLGKNRETMAQIRADEISRVFAGGDREFDAVANVSENRLGDQRRRPHRAYYGLKMFMAGELVEFGPQTVGLRSTSKKIKWARCCWAITLGKRRRPGEAHRRIMSIPVGDAMVGRV